MEPEDMDNNDIIGEYMRGNQDYWSGVEAEGWDSKDALHSPYLAGWNHAADSEHNQNFFAEVNE